MGVYLKRHSPETGGRWRQAPGKGGRRLEENRYLWSHSCRNKLWNSAENSYRQKR